MKNKFYVTKTKTRAAFFALSLLFCGLFASSLQAQVTHNWKTGTVGLFSDPSNWDTFNIATWATTSSTLTTLTAAVTAIPGTIAIGDIITGGNITGGSTLTVSVIDLVGRTITFTTTGIPVTPTAAATYTFTGLRASTVPGTASTNVAQINSGTCTIDVNPAVFRTLFVGNTSTSVQGKLIINTGVTLTLSANGGTSPVLDMRGGLITNNGVINATATAANGIVVRFLNATAEPDSDWGIVGPGTMTLTAGGVAPTAVVFFTFLQTTVTRVPTLRLNSGSTANLAATSTFPAVIFAAAAGGKGSIEGDGITLGGAGKAALFNTSGSAGLPSVIDIASTVTLTSEWLNTRGTGNDIAGTVNNFGSITYLTGCQLKIAGNGVSTLNNFGKLDLRGAIVNAGNIVNKSTATSSGSINSNGTSIPACTQERYLASNQRGWRLLGNPLPGYAYSSVETLSPTPITLGTGTIKTYNSASDTWAVTDVAVTPNWGSRNAISLFVRGRTSEVTTNVYTTVPADTPSNVTLSIKGSAANTAPTQIVTVAGRYYLLANPYTAPISVSGILGASTGLSSTVSYYNPTIGAVNLITKAGGYTNPIVSGAAGSATDVIIPVMGAIFVQASADGTIDIPTSTIFTGTPTAPSGNYNLRVKQVAAVNSLKLEVSAGAVYHDAVTLRFKSAADASSNIDFGKLPNEIFNAYTFSGSNKMAVSELELAAKAIPLGVTTTLNQGYSFKVAENTIPAGFEAVLFDSYLNKNTVLTVGTDYAFAIDSNPASQGDTRFVINLKASGTLGLVANELDSKIKLWPNPARAEVNITNEQSINDGASKIEISSLNGQLIHSQKSNPGTTTTIQTKGWSAGVYILKASNNGTETTKKLIIQ